MARIPMTSGFVVIPEGEYVFRIYDATYDEEFGRIVVKLVTASGLTHQERFSIKNSDDEYNEKNLEVISKYENVNVTYKHFDFNSLGLSKGRNIGLESTKTEYFVYCDDDFLIQ